MEIRCTVLDKRSPLSIPRSRNHQKWTIILSFSVGDRIPARVHLPLRYVWLGVLTHFILDVVGTTRGIALFYPFPREYDLPIGIPVTSRFALAVTLCITAGEIVLVAGLMQPTATIDVQTLPLPF